MLIFLPNSQLMPHDPSTLALAIVGIATLAVYFAATGWRPLRSDKPRTSNQNIAAPNHRRATNEAETTTRDAA